MPPRRTLLAAAGLAHRDDEQRLQDQRHLRDEIRIAPVPDTTRSAIGGGPMLVRDGAVLNRPSVRVERPGRGDRRAGLLTWRLAARLRG